MRRLNSVVFPAPFGPRITRRSPTGTAKLTLTARYNDLADVERDLEFDYARNRGKSRLEWEKSRHAVQAGWDRIGPTWE